MSTKSNVLMLLLCSTSVGCSNGFSSATKPHKEGFMVQNQKITYGVPLIQTIEASTVRLDEDWVLTAKHNKHLLESLDLEVIYHPECDVALIKRPRQTVIQTGGSISWRVCRSCWLSNDA
ncbi:hypothetical protein ITG09_16515 [Vibrio cyclitrophicus]|nr:hypothetical protein [Vibrio cyclitrophicus]UPR54558.1 hypothetical protein ITG09_16515 [Vibrio cyclitrophicus]